MGFLKCVPININLDRDEARPDNYAYSIPFERQKLRIRVNARFIT